MLSAPESYSELKRLKTVRNYKNSPVWESKSHEFQTIMNEAIKFSSVAGGAISLIDEDVQILKCSHWLTLKEYPRKISIDAHSILSSQYFMVLDTLEDWRFKNNPIVKSYPHIRFYVGVPLISPTNGEVIGVFSIFDGFPRTNFDQKYITKLQESSQKIMSMFELDLDNTMSFNLNKKNSNNFENKNMESRLTKNKIGRATSDKSLSLIKPPIYEKDGSGNAYQQNLNFRFSKNNSSEEETLHKEFLNKFQNCNNFKTAGKILCEALSEKLKKFNLIYVIEVRVVEVYQIENQYFPNVNHIQVEKFKFTDKLQRIKKEEIKTRVINFVENGENDHLVNQTQTIDLLTNEDCDVIHLKSFNSELGVLVGPKVNNCKYNYGCCIPFVRDSSKLIRRKKIGYTSIADGNCNINNIPIELYLKTGGYLIGCFCENKTMITDDDINCILDSSNIYRKLYV